MTSITFTDYDIPFNRFDQPLLGVASDAVHLVFYWPGTSLGFVDKDWWVKHTEEFKRKMLEKQRGLCTWCEAPLDYNDITVDHVWPISKGGRNWTLNYQVLHWWCGIAKSDSIGWVLMRDLLVLRTLLDGRRQPGITIPPIPNKQWFVVGAALVVGGCLTVKWLRGDVHGMPRYEHLFRSAQEALKRNGSRFDGHLESACGFAQKARGIAGQLGRLTTHRVAMTAGEMPGLVGAAATRIRDASPESLAEPVGLALRSTRHAGGSLGDSARTAAGRVKSRAYRAPGLVRGATERVSDKLPRPQWKTRTAIALNT